MMEGSSRRLAKRRTAAGRLLADSGRAGEFFKTGQVISLPPVLAQAGRARECGIARNANHYLNR